DSLIPFNATINHRQPGDYSSHAGSGRLLNRREECAHISTIMADKRRHGCQGLAAGGVVVQQTGRYGSGAGPELFIGVGLDYVSVVGGTSVLVFTRGIAKDLPAENDAALCGNIWSSSFPASARCSSPVGSPCSRPLPDWLACYPSWVFAIIHL